MKGLELNVSKQNGMTLVEYQLGAADAYDDRVSDKVAQLGNIIPFQYKDEDGKRSIISYVHHDNTLEVMLKHTLKKADVLAILKGLLCAFEIGAAGVQISYLVRDTNYIYVEPDSLAVKCIMVPVKQDALGQSDIPNFFRGIVSRMRFDEEDKDNYVARILTLINADHYSNMKLKELVDAEMEKIGLFYTRDNGLKKEADTPANADAQNKEIKVNRVGVMNNMRPQGMPPMGQPIPQPMNGQVPPMGQPIPQPMNGQRPPMGQPIPQPMNGQVPPMGQPMNGQRPPMGQPIPQPMNGQKPPMGQPMPQPMNGQKPPMGQPIPQPMNGQRPPMGQPMPQSMNGQRPPMGQPMPQPMNGQRPPMGQPMPQPMNGQRPPMGQPIPQSMNGQKPPMGQPIPQSMNGQKPPMGQPKPQVPEMPMPQAPEMPKPQAPEMPKPQVPEMPKPQVPEMPKPQAPEMPKPQMPNGGLMGQLGGARPIPHFIRKSTGEVINITKPEFVIGKSKTKADYTIENNSAISREHCTVIQRDGVNYIKDNNSTNHTYVNGVELQPGKETLLKHKTEVRMGDEEFTFLLRKGE